MWRVEAPDREAEERLHASVSHAIFESFRLPWSDIMQLKTGQNAGHLASRNNSSQDEGHRHRSYC